MRKATQHRRRAIVAQLERLGCPIPPGPERLNFGLLRAIRRTCPGAFVLAALLLIPAPARPADARQTQADAIAFCLYNEARGEGKPGMHAVASVMYNRGRFRYYRAILEDRGAAYVGLILDRGQFSGAYPAAEIPEVFITGAGLPPRDAAARRYCYGLAFDLIDNRFIPNGFATHYFSGPPPGWARDLYEVHRIGRHTFGTMPRNRW